MTSSPPPGFSRRERQIMDILYRLGEGSVADIQASMPDESSYDAVRLTLGALGEKGHVTHTREGRRYVYRPSVPRGKASRQAARRLLRTYFRGSPSEAIMTLLDVSSKQLSEEELDEIQTLIGEAKSARAGGGETREGGGAK